MIELNKQEVCIGERSAAAFSQAYCEGDVIVPDAKPDLAKILHASSNAVIISKHCARDRIAVEGRCDVTVLYISEHGSVCAINTSLNFSHTVDARGVTEGMDAELEADLQSIDCSIINSRKISVKMLVAIDANATAAVTGKLCSGLSSDCDAQLLKRVIRPYNKVYRGSEQITLKENLELPAGKPDIDTILKSEMRLAVNDVKVMEDKVIVGGTGVLAVMYVDCADRTALRFVEYELPFSEIIEAPGANENMTANVKIKCEQLYVEPCCDSDGDNRRINVECVACVCIKVFCETELEIIEDAYSTSKKLEVSCDNAVVDRLAACNKMQVTIRDTAELPNEISQVYRVFAKPNVSDTVIEDGKVRVDGVMEIDILYMPSEGGAPVCGFKHMHKFSQYVECSGIDESMLCDVNVMIEHISYSIAGSREVEFRVTSTIDTRIIAKTDICFVDEITEEELPKQECRGCRICIYFVQRDDKVWDIAKNHNTTVEKILEDNELSGENDICAGKRLILS